MKLKHNFISAHRRSMKSNQKSLLSVFD